MVNPQEDVCACLSLYKYFENLSFRRVARKKKKKKKKKKDHVYAAVKFWFSITSPDLHIDHRRQQRTILIYTKLVTYLKKIPSISNCFRPDIIVLVDWA